MLCIWHANYFPYRRNISVKKGGMFVFLTEYTHLNIYEPTNLAPVVNQVTTTYRALFKITINSHTFSVVKCIHFVLSVCIQFMISKVIYRLFTFIIVFHYPIAYLSFEMIDIAQKFKVMLSFHGKYCQITKCKLVTNKVSFTSLFVGIC